MTSPQRDTICMTSLVNGQMFDLFNTCQHFFFLLPKFFRACDVCLCNFSLLFCVCLFVYFLCLRLFFVFWSTSGSSLSSSFSFFIFSFLKSLKRIKLVLAFYPAVVAWRLSAYFISCMTLPRWVRIWLGAKKISVVIQILREALLLIMFKN